MNINEVIYQIYPLGFCGAPAGNDGKLMHRINRIKEWIPYFRAAGITAVLFNPVFESDSHGYDVRDYSLIDCRLGTNEDFAEICNALHDAGIKVILDVSYNHCGRGSSIFLDVLKNKQESLYKDWFHITFDDHERDGFSYACWQGYRSLPELNLQNESVIRYLISRTDQWIGEFGIDGLRIDVAYMLDRRFIRRLCSHIRASMPDFIFIGECMDGNFHDLLDEGMLNSVTNYEFRNALIQAFNDHNMHTLYDCLLRQYPEDRPDFCRSRQLLTFADNHDINRIASELRDPDLLFPLYALLFSVPGIPCIYYGSEWGAKGKRRRFTDKPLRPAYSRPVRNSLSAYIQTLSHLHRTYSVFARGDFKILYTDNEQFVFRRRTEKGQLTFALNLSHTPVSIPADTEVGQAFEMTEKKKITFTGELHLSPKRAYLWYTDWI